MPTLSSSVNYWQPPVPPVTTKLASWYNSRFSVGNGKVGIMTTLGFNGCGKCFYGISSLCILYNTYVCGLAAFSNLGRPFHLVDCSMVPTCFAARLRLRNSQINASVRWRSPWQKWVRNMLVHFIGPFGRESTSDWWISLIKCQQCGSFVCRANRIRRPGSGAVTPEHCDTNLVKKVKAILSHRVQLQGKYGSHHIIQYTFGISGYFYPQNSQNRPHSLPVRTTYGCLLLVSCLNNVLPLSLVRCVQYCDILGRYIQWNLSITTTSMIKFIACDLFSNVF